MPDWVSQKLIFPLITAVAGFALGLAGTEIKARWFPENQAAAINDVRLLRNVTLRDYLRSTDRSVSKRSNADLDRLGIVVIATIKTTGYKHHDLVFGGSTERTIGIDPYSTSSDLPGPSPVISHFKPAADQAEDSPDIWVADPCANDDNKILVSVKSGTKAIQRKTSRAFGSSLTRCAVGRPRERRARTR